MTDSVHSANAETRSVQAHTPWVVHPMAHKFGGHIVPASHAVRPIGGSTDVTADRDNYALKICTVYEDAHGRIRVLDVLRLIAAAPELLEALQALLSDVDEVASRCGWADHGARKQARAAIAKATGSTS